jgi:hypothetical protein
VDRGFGTYHYGVNHYDTNGTITKYYWSLSNDTAAATKTDADSMTIDIDETRINKGFARYVWAKDDDGLVRGGRFVVFADSAPPVPTVGAVKAGDSIRVEWFDHDKKDSCFTEFRILYKKTASPSPAPTLAEADSLTGWLPGLSAFNYIESTKGYSYTFKPTGGTGYYFFQVIARDARKTKTWSTNKPYVNY